MARSRRSLRRRVEKSTVADGRPPYRRTHSSNGRVGSSESESVNVCWLDFSHNTHQIYSTQTSTLGNGWSLVAAAPAGFTPRTDFSVVPLHTGLYVFGGEVTNDAIAGPPLIFTTDGLSFTTSLSPPYGTARRSSRAVLYGNSTELVELLVMGGMDTIERAGSSCVRASV